MVEKPPRKAARGKPSPAESEPPPGAEAPARVKGRGAGERTGKGASGKAGKTGKKPGKGAGKQAGKKSDKAPRRKPARAATAGSAPGMPEDGTLGTEIPPRTRRAGKRERDKAEPGTMPSHDPAAAPASAKATKRAHAIASRKAGEGRGASGKIDKSASIRPFREETGREPATGAAAPRRKGAGGSAKKSFAKKSVAKKSVARTRTTEATNQPAKRPGAKPRRAARKTFLVAATLSPGAADGGLRVYAAVTRSAAEALDAVRAELGADVAVELTGSLSARMAKALRLKPDEVRPI